MSRNLAIGGKKKKKMRAHQKKPSPKRELIVSLSPATERQTAAKGEKGVKPQKRGILVNSTRLPLHRGDAVSSRTGKGEHPDQS